MRTPLASVDAAIVVPFVAIAALFPAVAAAQPAASTEICCAADIDLWPEDPNATRLLFGPTARTLPRGRASLGAHALVVPSLQIGITDRVSFGGGTPLMFPLGDERPYWITPKIQVLNRSNTQVAIGAVHTLNLGGAGLAYGVMTSGTSRRSVTVGGGIAYSRDGGRSVVIMAGGDRQVRRSMKFLTENYYWGGQAVISAGVRFFDEKKALDAGVAAPISKYFYGLVPVLNFVYRF